MSATQRKCDWVLVFSGLLFVWSAWPSLTYGPIGLDDRGLIDSFTRVSFGRVWGYDHFGHLRPNKNLCFWMLAQHPTLISTLHVLNLFAALTCAWLVRSLSLVLGASPLTAASSAALWLLNPITAVGVTWLSASNYLFALLGMLLYLLSLERAVTAARRAGVSWAAAHVALLFAVLSHELAMLAPVWALLRYGLRARASGPSARPVEWRAFFVGAVVVLAVPLALRLSHRAPELAYRSELPALQLMASAAYDLWQNIRLWLWLPGRFGVLLSQTSALDPLWSSAAWLGTAGLGWLLWKITKPAQRLALAWALLFLLPVINLLPLGVTPVAMHYLILPGAGLAWLVASAIAGIARRRPRQAPALTILLTTALMLSWLPAFRGSVKAFRNDIALYQASLADYPDNPEVRVNLIAAFTAASQTARAQTLLSQSLALAPDHPGLLKHQLFALLQSERHPEALAWFERHAALLQNDADLELRRALLLRRLGRKREVEPIFEHILTISKDPKIRAAAGYQLANLQVQSGRLREAQALLRNLQAEQPKNPEINQALKLINETLQPPPPKSPTTK